MEYLSLSDLIACSTLNRQCYSATRSQDLCASVHRCYQLQYWHFHMKAISKPFSCLSFETGDGCCVRSENLNFADVPLKKVIFSGWAFCRNICTSLRFLSQVLYMENLQELCITTHWLESVSPTWTNLLENGQVLKNLRVLQILEREVKVESVVDLIRSLIDASSRLQYLDCYVTPKQALSLGKTKPWVIKYVTFLPPNTSQDEALYEQFALLDPKLWGLRASRSDTMGSMRMGIGGYRLSYSAWNILRRLLLSTCSSLRQLAIGSYVGEKLGQDTELREAVFLNVRGMILDIDIRAGVESLGALQFPRVFPQLSSVIVRPRETYCIFDDDPQNLNSLSITEIFLLYVSSRRLMGCSRLFPYVTSLTLDDSPFETGLLQEACQAWPRLKRFKIGDGANLRVLEPYELDSLLCGMTLSEAEDMSRKGTEFLKKVNFVHRRYSLVNLTGIHSVMNLFNFSTDSWF